MSHRIDWQIVTDISVDRGAFFFKVNGIAVCTKTFSSWTKRQKTGE